MKTTETSVRDVAVVVGKKVKAQRKRRKWSQYDLAAKSGIERASITRLEAGRSGERGMSLAKLVAIANALGVSVKELLPSQHSPSHP